MEDMLKVGVVSFGGAGMALYHHFNSIPNCSVVSVFDPKPDALERARKQSAKLFVTDNFSGFLSSGIDVVVVCSPDRTHDEYITASLHAQKHVLCEKPLTDSMDGIKRILLAEKASPGCVAAVQHQMRFLPVHLKMEEIIKSGQLGKISYVEGYYVHNLTTRASIHDKWRFEDNATPLVYSGCHMVDLLRWLLKDEVVEVVGMANNIAFPEYPESDLNVILLRFRSGIIGKVITAFGAGRPQDHSVRVYGTAASIENNILFTKDGKYSVFARPFVKTTSSMRGDMRSVLGSFRRNYMSKLAGRLSEIVMSMANFPGEYSISSYPFRLYEHDFAVRESALNFINAIRLHQTPKCTLTDSAKTVATCLAGVEAYRTGRTVSMDKYKIDVLRNT